jgi:hypothetical protein
MMTWNWKNEWTIVRAAISEWESFIFSDTILWPINFDREHGYEGGMKPRLSAGRLLIAVFFLDYFQKYDESILLAVSEDLHALQKLKSTWKSNWQKKINAELPFRLRQFEEMLAGVGKASLSAAEYANQILIRLMIDFLVEESSQETANQFAGQILTLDRRLKMNTRAGDFVWGPEVEPAFDKTKFWYLFSVSTAKEGRK